MTTRAWLASAVLASIAVVGAFGVLHAYLEREEQCNLTPPGYFEQRVVSIETGLLWKTCVLDPGNGDPPYTIHRPWQGVRDD